MTGESEAVEINSDRPMLLGNCRVIEGAGEMLVIAVGRLSQWGRITALLQQEQVRGQQLFFRPCLFVCCLSVIFRFSFVALLLVVT